MPERTVLAPDHGGIPGAARQGKVVVCKGAKPVAAKVRHRASAQRVVSGLSLNERLRRRAQPYDRSEEPRFNKPTLTVILSFFNASCVIILWRDRGEGDPNPGLGTKKWAGGLKEPSRPDSPV
jgi:hypothetical protein